MKFKNNMTQMLYTKYRPSKLADIQNQSSVVDVLQKSIASGNIGHAYLFTGGRGIGKTSIARAFARDLAINEADIFEMDAASNSRIEDIRQLGENINSLPFYSKYTMYILDEVHMLSKAAANAFLKILEEPPAHVIFVLATTDPQKLPETILSRCLHFTLNKPTISEIESHLEKVAKTEGYTLDKSSLRSIAIVGDGSYRDSLAALQKVISSSGEKNISEDQTSKSLNISPLTSVFKYIKALDTKQGKDIEIALQTLRDLENSRQNVNFFVKNVIIFTRIILLLRFGIQKMDSVEKEYGDYVATEMKNLLENKAYKINSKVISSLLDAEKTSNSSRFEILPYELLILE